MLRMTSPLLGEGVAFLINGVGAIGQLFENIKLDMYFMVYIRLKIENLKC